MSSKHGISAVIHTAVALNEQFLTQFQRKNFDAALSPLVEALKVLSMELRCQKHNQNMVRTAQADCSSTEPVQSVCARPRCFFVFEEEEPPSCTCSEQTRDTDIDVDDGNDCTGIPTPHRRSSSSVRHDCSREEKSFFSDAADSGDPLMINAPIKLRLPSIPTEENLDICSYGIVYNLAFYHHCMAQHFAMSNHFLDRTTLLKKSMKLYEKAHSLLAGNLRLNLHSSSKWLGADGFFVHALVLMNNIGHVHHSLGHYGRANACFRRLSGDIMYAVVQSHSNHDYFSEQNPGILSNLSCMDIIFHNITPFLSCRRDESQEYTEARREGRRSSASTGKTIFGTGASLAASAA